MPEEQPTVSEKEIALKTVAVTEFRLVAGYDGVRHGWKSSCRARAALLLRIAPFTVVNYKADPAAARAHVAGRPATPSKVNRNLEISWKSVGNQHAEIWKSHEIMELEISLRSFFWFF